jgi:hypothetical protein
MSAPQQYRKISADVAEADRRCRRIIGEIAQKCAESRRELEASYDLLRNVQRSMNDGSPPKSVKGDQLSRSGGSGHTTRVGFTPCP